jgi:hypothetical protein
MTWHKQGASFIVEQGRVGSISHHRYHFPVLLQAMASTNRSRRGHLSSKIPNVKLRPASSRPNNAIAETSRTSKGKARERAASPDNLMDQEMIRRLYKEDEGEERDGDSGVWPHYPIRTEAVRLSG